MGREGLETRHGEHQADPGQINDHCQDKEEIRIDIEFKAPKVIFAL
jgi:hypothetical protein